MVVVAVVVVVGVVAVVVGVAVVVVAVGVGVGVGVVVVVDPGPDPDHDPGPDVVGVAVRKRGYLTERLETSVDKDLYDWVLDHAVVEARTPASILRRALIVYRQMEEAHAEGVKILGTARKEKAA